MFSHPVKSVVKWITTPSITPIRQISSILNHKHWIPLPHTFTSLSAFVRQSRAPIPNVLYRPSGQQSFHITHPVHAFGKPMGNKRPRSYLGSGHQTNPPPTSAGVGKPSAAPIDQQPITTPLTHDLAASDVMSNYNVPEAIPTSNLDRLFAFLFKPGSGLQTMMFLPLAAIMVTSYGYYVKYFTPAQDESDSLRIGLRKQEQREKVMARQNEKMASLADEIAQSLIHNKVDSTNVQRKGSIPGVLTDYEYPEPVDLTHRLPIANAHAAAHMIYADYVGKGHYIIYTNHSAMPVHHMINKIIKDNPGMPFTYEVRDPEF